MAKQKKPSLNKNSQRVVVDEIFDDGTARLLRAQRLTGIVDRGKFNIDSWGAEEEDFIESWRVEAFVGFPSSMKLREGDVFYIADGSKMNAKYKPIPRERARKEHLLLPWDKSRQIARDEIKMQYSKLTAINLSISTKDRKSLINKVEKKFNTDF